MSIRTPAIPSVVVTVAVPTHWTIHNNRHVHVSVIEAGRRVLGVTRARFRVERHSPRFRPEKQLRSSETSQNVDPQASSENHGPPLIDPNLTSLLVYAPLLEALKFSAPALQPEADKKDGISDADE